MLDVHPPHHPIGGARDFFTHLATISVGLLIALGLENAVEALHHRSQRHEAEEKIREEIRHNLETLATATPGFEQERALMRQLIAQMRVIRAGQPSDLKEIKLAFHEEEIPDAAWRTASSTGVLEYMPYEEVERFADAYREQALLQTMAQRTLNDYLELTSMVDHQPDKQEAAEILPIVQRALGDLNGIEAAGEGTVASYKAALK